MKAHARPSSKESLSKFNFGHLKISKSIVYANLSYKKISSCHFLSARNFKPHVEFSYFFRSRAKIVRKKHAKK